MPSVLVVDDDLDTGKILVRLLQLSGLDAAFVASGEEALDSIQAQLPSLMILDVMMPGIGGFDVLRMVRADPKLQALPVVMYSALSDAESRQKAMRLGASDYLVKGGFDYDRLSEMVERHAGTHS